MCRAPAGLQRGQRRDRRFGVIMPCIGTALHRVMQNLKDASKRLHRTRVRPALHPSHHAAARQWCSHLVARKQYAVAVMQLCEVAEPDVFWHREKVVGAALCGMHCTSTGGTARPLGVRSTLALGGEKGEHARAVSDGDCRHTGASSFLRAQLGRERGASARAPAATRLRKHAP